VRLPGTLCPVTGTRCSQTCDCRDCPLLQGAEDYDWVCSFCALGSRDVRHTGETADEFHGGLYASGACGRCRSYRICLMAVSRRQHDGSGTYNNGGVVSEL
jgi:hypothetical protein